VYVCVCMCVCMCGCVGGDGGVVGCWSVCLIDLDTITSLQPRDVHTNRVHT